MDSLKNTIVAVMLLGVTYGVYQVVTTPDPTVVSQNALLDTVIEGSPFDESGPTAAPTIPAALLAEPAPFEATPALPPVATDQQPKLLTAGSGDIRGLKDFLETPDNATTTGALADIKPRDSLSQPPQPMVAQPEIAQPEIAQPGVAQAGVAQAGGTIKYDADRLALVWPQVNQLVDEGEFRIALRRLSLFYNNANLMSESEQQKLFDWLDSLAAKVIYSTEHHLRSVPYIIQPNDTLDALSSRWKVPADLIYFVNRAKIPDRNSLQPGNELKMINGAFDAEIDTANGTMTLFWKQLYAGRFKIQVDPQTKPVPGEFQIVTKSIEPVTCGPYHIGLDNGMSLHALAPAATSSIGMEEQQAKEVFAILSESSTVRIIR